MTVACADFFELQGESILTCNAVSNKDADWSSDAPTCKKGNFLLLRLPDIPSVLVANE